MSDFQEVTDREKSTLETSDAKWVKPDSALIARAQAANIVYNESTGFFELNGLTDLTADDTLHILEAGRPVFGAKAFYANNDNLRTNLPAHHSSFSADHAFLSTHNIEVANCYGMIAGVTMFLGNRRLKRIINMYSLNADVITQGAFTLSTPEFISGAIRGKYPTIDFRNCSLLGADSVQTWLDNAFNKVAITIILHPDAYARVTDEQFALAAEKNITFATP